MAELNLKKKKGESNLPLKIAVYTLLVLWAIAVLFPFYWMLLSSVKTFGEYNAESIPKLYAASPTLENYITAFKSVPLGDYFVNTVIYTVLTTLLMMVVIIPAAFAFARMNFKGKNLVFVIFLSLMMFPNELVIITN